MNLSDCQPFAYAYNNDIQCTAIYSFCPLCLCLQACQDGGGANQFGIGTVDSAQMGDVTESGWTFTISYTNAQQHKASHVAYTFAASGGQLTFTKEDPPNTYVSCCSFFSVHLRILHSSCIFYTCL